MDTIYFTKATPILQFKIEQNEINNDSNVRFIIDTSLAPVNIINKSKYVNINSNDSTPSIKIGDSIVIMKNGFEDFHVKVTGTEIIIRPNILLNADRGIFQEYSSFKGVYTNYGLSITIGNKNEELKRLRKKHINNLRRAR